MPDTDHYMTYEGSTTYPGCWETVTWIVMNKPIYISRQEMYTLKQLMQGDKINPKSPLAPNSRPIQESHNRSVRTNIYFPLDKTQNQQDSCPDVFENFNYATQVSGVFSAPWKSNQWNCFMHLKGKIVLKYSCYNKLKTNFNLFQPHFHKKDGKFHYEIGSAILCFEFD